MKIRLLISVLIVLFVLVSTIPAMADNTGFNSSETRTEIPVEDVCGPNTIFVDGICHLTIIDQPSHYVNTSPFYQSLLMFSVFLWPFFISGAGIFIVLAKTPHYQKSTRIIVTISGILVISGFLAMMSIGIWPQMGDWLIETKKLFNHYYNSIFCYLLW